MLLVVLWGEMHVRFNSKYCGSTEGEISMLLLDGCSEEINRMEIYSSLDLVAFGTASETAIARVQKGRGLSIFDFVEK